MLHQQYEEIWGANYALHEWPHVFFKLKLWLLETNNAADALKVNLLINSINISKTDII